MTEYQYKKSQGENGGRDGDHRAVTGQEGMQE